MTNPLGDLISRGEGGYNSYNRGTKHGRIVPAAHVCDFSRVTLDELTRRQRLPVSDPEKVFAVGKYQIIPTTMQGAIIKLHLDPRDRYTPQLQEKIFADYLIKDKRPDIYNYIVSKPAASLHAAQKAASQEWASIDDPDTPGQPFGEYAKHGNRSSIRAVQIADALDNMRGEYKIAVGRGLSEEDAWRSVTGQSIAFAKHHMPPAHLNLADQEIVLNKAIPKDNVGDLQRLLIKLGYHDPRGRSLTSDNIFGPNTKHAIKSFQRAHHLHVDGIVGKDTRAALIDAQHAPLLSEATHPQHHLYAQVLHGIHNLPPGTYRNEQERTNAAVALSISAHVAGLREVDHVVLGTNGVNLFAVQGKMDDPAHRRVHVEHGPAMAQSLSTHTLASPQLTPDHALAMAALNQQVEQRGPTMMVRP